MASTAGSIVLGIFADVAQLKTDLQRANHNIEDFSSKATRSLASLTKMAGGFASAFTGIGLALSGTALAAVAKQAIEVADNIGDMAERLGVGTDALQALQYAARDVGADAEGMATGIAKLNKLLGEAGAGNKEAIKSFQDLGVAFGEAGKLRSTEDVLRSVADRIAGAGSVAEKTRLAVEVFGKSGAALVPIFAKGAAGIDELVAKLREMGVIVDGAALKQADALQKQFDQLAATLQTTLIKAVLAAGPALAALATETQKSVEWFARLIDRVTALGAAALFGTAEARLKSLRAELENLRKIGMPGDVRVPQVQAQITALETARDLANEQKREAARGQTGGVPSGTAITAPVDPGAAKKAADEAKKAREAKQDADTKAVMDSITLEERMREEGAETFRFLEKLGADTATTRADAAMEEADRVAHGLAIEAKLREEIAADLKRVETETAAVREKDRETYLAGVKAKADAEAELDAIKQDYYEKEQARLDADIAKRGAMVDKLFAPFTRAFETAVTGIIQGTTTLDQAFQKLGQSIVISLGETAVKEGVDALKKALKELLESKLVQDLVKAGLSSASGLFTPGTGANVNVSQQYIDYNAMPMAAGGIVQSPTFAVVGEAGPEAVVPLDRWGEMGGNVTVNIIDQRREGSVQTQEKTTASGERQVDVLITDVVRAGLAGGSYDRALGGSFGLSRRGVQR